jgi:RES domain-containing protein
MILYRITKCTYANNLDGEGSRLFGGRWNSKGRPAIYLASSVALAVLEVLVHLTPLIIPDDYCLAEIELPDADITEIFIKDLPNDWKNVSPPASLRQFGDAFLQKDAHLLMKVPSSVVSMENNYLVNIRHPAMKKVKVIKVEPFEFDERLRR